MEKTSLARFPRLKLQIAPVLTAAFLAISACQAGGEGGEASPIPSPGEWSCDKILGVQAEQAVRRVSGIPDSIKISRSGDPKDAADELVANYDAGTPDSADRLDFCRFYRGSEVVIPAVEVRFSLTRKVEALSKNSIVDEYRMGRSARANDRLGILYFECTSDRFYLGGGATVLVRGESRVNPEPAASGVTAREDNLRIIYESSRAFSDLLGCKSNAGLPASFTMPPEVQESGTSS
ncbi:hypothetical protein [Streptomyces sp. NPDC006527]|uniref:hypothetical protein n=1 Tax=Streptomyces sp. NPDC006527 TaxID=3364749 RepID=UPI0036B869A1